MSNYAPLSVESLKQAALDFLMLPENWHDITITKLQRALGVSYGKAALLLEEFELEGILSRPDANFRRHRITDKREDTSWNH